MLKINVNQMKCENWSISNYQYDASTYNPDNFDMVPFGELCAAYSRVCAQMTSASSRISNIGQVTNSAGVKNVDIGSLKTQCLGNLSDELNSMVDNFGGFVNAVAVNTAANNKLFLPNGGKDIDNIAEYLKGYSSEYADAIINDDGTNVFAAFEMYDFGNGLTVSDDAGSRAHFDKEVSHDGGKTVSEEYKEYVESRFMTEDGKCKFEGCSIEDMKINPANGNVQVDFKATDGTKFTLNCNLTNPNALSNAYVSLPGTGGGGTYASQSYSDFIDNTQFNSNSKYITTTIRGTGSHDAANAAISQILGELSSDSDGNGGYTSHNLDKSVISAASASESLILGTARALMKQSDKMDLVLLDGVMPGCEVGETFTRQLLGSHLKNATIRNGKVIVNNYTSDQNAYLDVLDYLKENGTVYAYVSYRGSNPAYAASWMRQVANNGVDVVLCTNPSYTTHTSPENQIFAGELDRIFSDFSDSTTTEGFVSVATVSSDQSNPYIDVNGSNMKQDEINQIINNYGNNTYAVYEAIEGGYIEHPNVSLGDIKEILSR